MIESRWKFPETGNIDVFTSRTSCRDWEYQGVLAGDNRKTYIANLSFLPGSADDSYTCLSAGHARSALDAPSNQRRTRGGRPFSSAATASLPTA